MKATHANHNTQAFHHLLGQVGTATGQVVTPACPRCHMAGVQIELELLEWPAFHCVLITFTDTNFEIQDAHTLAFLLDLNRTIARESPFCTTLALDPSGKHLQLSQRIQVNDLPVWAIEQYFKETIERIQSMFVYTSA